MQPGVDLSDDSSESEYLTPAVTAKVLTKKVIQKPRQKKLKNAKIKRPVKKAAKTVPVAKAPVEDHQANLTHQHSMTSDTGVIVKGMMLNYDTDKKADQESTIRTLTPINVINPSKQR